MYIKNAVYTCITATTKQNKKKERGKLGYKRERDWIYIHLRVYGDNSKGYEPHSCVYSYKHGGNGRQGVRCSNEHLSLLVYNDDVNL